MGAFPKLLLLDNNAAIKAEIGYGKKTTTSTSNFSIKINNSMIANRINNQQKRKAHHFPVKLMGCGFVLTAIHESPQVAWDALRAGVNEIVRIEYLISSWKDFSQTSAINKAAGKAPVQVDKELIDLIQRSIKVSQLTGSAFDISGNLARHYYNFNNKGKTLFRQKKRLRNCAISSITKTLK